MEGSGAEAQAGARPTDRVPGSGGKKLLSRQEVRLASFVVGALTFLVVAYLLLSYSAFLGFLLIASAILAVLILRKYRGTQTQMEQRLFGTVGLYGRSARRAYEEGKHREVAQNAYQQSRRAYEEASVRYQQWSEEQAAQRESNEALRKVEWERGERRGRFERYRTFFERGYERSSYFLDWWRGYDTGEFDDEEASVFDLLLSSKNRADRGLSSMKQAEAAFVDLLEREEFEQADLLLNTVLAGQENLGGGESVFPPLMAVHERIKQSEGWASYRRDLEWFLKDLEDCLQSPNVRTSAANRVRFPDPEGPPRHPRRARPQPPASGEESYRDLWHVLTGLPIALKATAVGAALLVLLFVLSAPGFSAGLSASVFGVVFLVVAAILTLQRTLPVWLSYSFLVSFFVLVISIAMLGVSEARKPPYNGTGTSALDSLVSAGMRNSDENIVAVDVRGEQATIVIASDAPSGYAGSVCDFALGSALEYDNYVGYGESIGINQVAVSRQWRPWNEAACSL